MTSRPSPVGAERFRHRVRTADPTLGITSRRSVVRAGMRWVLAGLYLFAGIVHLVSPEIFLPIVPDWVPVPREIVLLTGTCEIAGVIGLMTRRFRWWAGVLLAAYAVAVFPANIKHAVDDVAFAGGQLGWAYHGPRFLLQPVLVWWALFAASVIDWPFRTRSSRRP